MGGGEVASMDVELVVESFGLHYLGPRAHQVYTYIYVYMYNIYMCLYRYRYRCRYRCMCVCIRRASR